MSSLRNRLTEKEETLPKESMGQFHSSPEKRSTRLWYYKTSTFFSSDFKYYILHSPPVRVMTQWSVCLQSCGSGAKCVTMKCLLGDFDYKATITLSSRLWNNTFVEVWKTDYYVCSTRDLRWAAGCLVFKNEVCLFCVDYVKLKPFVSLIWLAVVDSFCWAYANISFIYWF